VELLLKPSSNVEGLLSFPSAPHQNHLRPAADPARIARLAAGENGITKPSNELLAVAEPDFDAWI
jgi:hypothetical protein